MEIITQSTATAVIDAPIASINLTDWLFTLSEAEYCSCSDDHIACGSSLDKEGRRMSVNVEQVAGNLLVQHYIEDIGEKDFCRVISASDSFSDNNRTKLAVVWELKVEKLTEKSCTFYNHVVIGFTEEFKALLKNAGLNDLEEMKKGMGVNLAVHNADETPKFALNIEQKALLGIWK